MGERSMLQAIRALSTMRENDREIWSEGFAHGQALSDVAGVCPYPHGSAAADAWLDGWYQGALKTDGLSYRDGPITEPGTSLVWAGLGNKGRHQGGAAGLMPVTAAERKKAADAAP